MTLFLAFIAMVATVGVILEIRRRRSDRSQFDAGDVYIPIGPPAHRKVKLTEEEQSQLAEFMVDKQSVEGSIRAARSMLAISSSTWDIDYYTRRINDLKVNLKAVDEAIRNLESGRDRPENHVHGDLIPVESSGEVVAWICGRCDAQLDDTDPTVKRFIDDGIARAEKIAQRAAADRKWNGLWSELTAEDQAKEGAEVRKITATTEAWTPERAERHKRLVDRLISDRTLQQEFVREARNRRKEGWT